MTGKPQRRWLGYILALLAVAAAAAATRGLLGLGKPGISPLLFVAVLFSAWYGGVGPGLLATLLSVVAAAWLLAPAGVLGMGVVHEHLLRLMVFATVAVLASSLHAALHRAHREAQAARLAAESASAAKSRFLAMVSHELRTPLSPVLMAAEMLAQDPALPPAMLADVQTIRRNVDLEIRLIEDLVDLTRIAAGKLRLDLRPLDLREPIEAAITVCQGDMTRKRLALAVEFPPAPLMVMGDPVRLQQVFWNLLRNAVKFTPAGGQLTVSAEKRQDKAVAVVRDTGIGIEPGKLNAIFEAFEQAGEEIQVQFGGLGLGLAICKGLIDAQGGRISAQSAGQGAGATFTVELPVTPGLAVSYGGAGALLPTPGAAEEGAGATTGTT